MNDRFTRNGRILGGLTVVVVLAAVAAPTTSAQVPAVSEGCERLNDPNLDGRYDPTQPPLGTLTFAAGDRISVSAREPSEARPDTVVLTVGAQLQQTTYPGTLAYVIPSIGAYDVVWYVESSVGTSPLATWEVSCSPEPPPDCSGVRANPTTLKSGGKLQQVTLSGASDPEGDALTYRITGVTQDEPVASGLRGDTAFPDALGANANAVSLRGERNGKGNGRVYRISYTVADGFTSCSGVVTVSVAVRKGRAAFDDGDHASWNSFTGAAGPAG